MESILNLIRRYSRCCLNCGSFSADLGCLCADCESVLKIWKTSESEIKTTSFVIRTLYRWQPGQSDLLSRLVLWLKGSQQKESWRHFAEKICQENSHHLPEGRKIYVVPAPGKGTKKDHAFLWAEGIAQSLGAELVPCLQKVGNSRQRGSDRGTRALIEMTVHEKYTEAVAFKSQTLWIFADDIVTTGATARSAHIALGYPEHFEVWVLAQRGLSCGASKDLL